MLFRIRSTSVEAAKTRYGVLETTPRIDVHSAPRFAIFHAINRELPRRGDLFFVMSPILLVSGGIYRTFAKSDKSLW
jgi:hypothetical protein